MTTYRSSKVTQGRHNTLARLLWRATGMGDDDFAKPIVAVANSFTQFVPGHIHLKDLGQLVAREIEAAGGVAKEFNTIAVDDGIAMGHDGMLYSLPSRDLIADSIEYMVNGHCADALVCISNCDKITPGMLMAALRLNIPTVFVSGGPMEAGRIQREGQAVKVDGITAIVAAGDMRVPEREVLELERAGCPTCGSCSGMYTANSMNCLTEALGLALPGNGTLLATHADRKELFLQAGRLVVDLCRRHYQEGDASVLPRAIASRAAFENAMRLDVAMGGSTNTVLHLLAAAQEAEVDFTLADIDRISRETPHLAKLSPSTARWHVEDVHRAGGIIGLLGELDRLGVLDTTAHSIHADSLAQTLARWDIRRDPAPAVREFWRAAPGWQPTQSAFTHSSRWESLDLDRAQGCVRDGAHAYSQDGGLAVLRGNLAPDGCVVKTAGVDAAVLRFTGKAVVFESENAVAAGISGGRVKPGDVAVVRYEGPKGGPGMQEMLKPTSLMAACGLATSCALVTDGRFSGGSAGLSIGHVSPEAAGGGPIALVRDGDEITIDIPARTITLHVPDEVLAGRRAEMLALGPRAFKPAQRQRRVSKALRAYAALVSSADKGAVRDLSRVE